MKLYLWCAIRDLHYPWHPILCAQARRAGRRLLASSPAENSRVRPDTSSGHGSAMSVGVSPPLCRGCREGGGGRSSRHRKRHVVRRFRGTLRAAELSLERRPRRRLTFGVRSVLVSDSIRPPTGTGRRRRRDGTGTGWDGTG